MGAGLEKGENKNVLRQTEIAPQDLKTDAQHFGLQSRHVFQDGTVGSCAGAELRCAYETVGVKLSGSMPSAAPPEAQETSPGPITVSLRDRR